RDRAAMGTDDLGGDGETEAGAAGPRAALEGLEEVAAGTLAHARAGVADTDRNAGAVAAAAHRQAADDGRALVAAVQGLRGVPAEIDEDAEELVGVGVDLEPGRHLVLEGDGGVADKAEGVGDVVDQAVERDKPAFGRRL